MNKRSLFFTVALTISLTTLLNISIRNLPPLGKCLDPFQGIWQNAETQSVNLPKSLSLPGLQACVTVQFDKHLIPHIIAQNDTDLYFAQGYVTALHRLWQMDFQTYAAAGRIAEIVGLKALDFDRLQRRKGNLYAAKNVLAEIEKDHTLHNVVHAYVAGVNAYIHTLSYKDLPLEYKLLNYHPEPWTPLKVALMMAHMIEDLCGGDNSIENTNALHQLGKEKFDFLFPAYFEKSEPVIPRNTPWNFKPIAVQPPAPLQIPQQRTQIGPTQSNRASGSNSWAISGKKTITGAPYLANDPHLVMQLPSVWYGMHLQSPTVNVFGGTIPGLPSVAVGFNESIAWGVTNAARNVKNWHVIDFKDESKQEYYYDNLLLKTQWVTEAIKVRGSNTFYDTVIYTHFGPIVYDEQFPSCQERNHLAMKWLGHHPGKELLTFYLLNRAKDFKDFEEALQHYHVPSQNFSFAAASDDIGIYIAGRTPVQWKDQGRFIMPGNTAAYEWSGDVPKEHLPKILNPTSGYVSSANERSTDEYYPYHYHHYAEEHYRNRRASQVLCKLKGVDEKAMMQLQNDNYNLAAQESLPLLLKEVNTHQLNEEQKAAYQTLLNWNYHNEVDQLAPSIFQAWQEQLNVKLWGSLQNGECALPTPCFYRTVEILKHHPRSPHLDLGEYATVGELIHAAFTSGVQALEAWRAKHQKPYRWGDYRQVFINHLANMTSFGLYNLQINGGDHILNANEGNRGASMRLVVALGTQPKGWFIYPGGQSGNPGSPYYTSFVESWRQGKYIPVTIDTRELHTDEAFTLTLRPIS
ncbi:MAG: penicillin acylase family protein [Amoebophilaceae bacterium]|jgi:penicillin amidase|nr:penicillin acylase family protein [Amoebophilaceae bacterium]